MGRVVNLAVPLTFKRVVDTLSTVTARVSKDGAAATLRALCGLGAPGDPPITFWDVFVPWVAAYLALYFLQGGWVVGALLHRWLRVGSCYSRLAGPAPQGSCAASTRLAVRGGRAWMPDLPSRTSL